MAREDEHDGWVLSTTNRTFKSDSSYLSIYAPAEIMHQIYLSNSPGDNNEAATVVPTGCCCQVSKSAQKQDPLSQEKEKKEPKKSERKDQLYEDKSARPNEHLYYQISLIPSIPLAT